MTLPVVLPTPRLFLANLRRTRARPQAPLRSLIPLAGRSHTLAFSFQMSLECCSLQSECVICFSAQLQSEHVSERSIDESERYPACVLPSTSPDYSSKKHSVSTIPCATRISTLGHSAWVLLSAWLTAPCFFALFSPNIPSAPSDCLFFSLFLDLPSIALAFVESTLAPHTCSLYSALLSYPLTYSTKISDGCNLRSNKYPSGCTPYSPYSTLNDTVQ